jgi:hypothetical protein
MKNELAEIIFRVRNDFIGALRVPFDTTLWISHRWLSVFFVVFTQSPPKRCFF